MKKLKLLTALICIIVTNSWATTYYVSKTGNNSNNGTDTTRAWRTLTYAASASSPVAAGDIVYVKAGDYGNEHVIFEKTGTSLSPISFIGYKTIPGDAPPVLANNVNPYAAYVVTNMPTYNGGNRTSAGIAFSSKDKKYLIIKNFQISNYTTGVSIGTTENYTSMPTTSGNNTLNNINVMTCGNPSYDYSGRGIWLGVMGTSNSNDNTITNCLVVNCAAEGFGINGNNNTINSCKVYCNESADAAPTDYYIYICGNTNTITNCYIERDINVSNNAHGIGAKSNAEQVVDNPGDGITNVINPTGNYFAYNTAKNISESYYVRHRGVQQNKFYHCKAIGTRTNEDSPEGNTNAFVTRDGARNNVFDGCIAEKLGIAFYFCETTEDGGTQTSYGNKYVNCIINTCYAAIVFGSNATTFVGTNTIANCTFYKNLNHYGTNSNNSAMKYVGNIYYGCDPGGTSGTFKYSTFSITPSQFKQCNFINIQNQSSAIGTFYGGGTTNIALDPLFAAAGSGNFHLTSLSPCIDKVDSTNFNYPFDFDGRARYNGIKSDMGAFEYYSSATSKTICLGQGTTLTAGPVADSYSWSPATGLSATSGATVTASPSATTTYTVTSTLSGGSTMTETFNVNVRTVPITAGVTHSAFLYCGTCINGGLSLTGSNSSGQLANGNNTSVSTPVFLQGLLGVTAVSAGKYHTLFLKSDGTVWSSGYSGYGQLGDGSSTARNTPTQVTGLTGVVAIAAGEEHSLFLKSDGTVWGCGNIYDGRLGGYTVHQYYAAQISGLTGIVAIAAGQAHSVFLKSDGTVYACGRNTNGQLGDGTTANRTSATSISGLSAVKAIAAGASHSLFLLTNGTVKATGLNTNGQLGDGTTTQRTTPVAVSTLTNISHISAGGTHSAFIQNNATAWACGDNSYGQLGDATTTQRNSPVTVSSLSGATIIGISAGYYYTLFLKSNGTVLATGKNTSGQLGDGATTNRSSAVQVLTTNTCGPLGAPLAVHSEIINSNAGLIYPNPANEELTIQLSEVAEQETNITLFDGLGRLVIQNRLSAGESIKKINTKSLTPGIYFIHIQNSMETVKRKVVITHN